MKLLILKAEELVKNPLCATYMSYIHALRGTKVTSKAYFAEVKNATYFLLTDGKTLFGIGRCSDLTEQFVKLHTGSITKPSDYKMVSSVYVPEKFRGKGYAKQIVKEMCKKYPKLLLDTYLSWKPAVMLYLSVGFKIIARKKYHNDDLLLFSHIR